MNVDSITNPKPMYKFALMDAQSKEEVETHLSIDEVKEERKRYSPLGNYVVIEMDTAQCRDHGIEYSFKERDCDDCRMESYHESRADMCFSL